MKYRLNFVNSELNKLKKNNLLRELQDTTVEKQFIYKKNQKLLNLSSNDYLGLNVGNFQFKQFQSSSRSVTGNDTKFSELEKKISAHKSQEKTLVYPTGYMANLGAITAIIEKKDTIFSDELNHASIIEACRLTNAKIKIYKHNDMKNLESKIKKTTGKKFIITEGKKTKIQKIIFEGNKIFSDRKLAQQFKENKVPQQIAVNENKDILDNILVFYVNGTAENHPFVINFNEFIHQR